VVQRYLLHLVVVVVLLVLLVVLVLLVQMAQREQHRGRRLMVEMAFPVLVVVMVVFGGKVQHYMAMLVQVVKDVMMVVVG
jgi:hypothetical protein